KSDALSFAVIEIGRNSFENEIAVEHRRCSRQSRTFLAGFGACRRENRIRQNACAIDDANMARSRTLRNAHEGDDEEAAAEKQWRRHQPDNKSLAHHGGQVVAL